MMELRGVYWTALRSTPDVSPALTSWTCLSSAQVSLYCCTGRVYPAHRLVCIAALDVSIQCTG